MAPDPTPAAGGRDPGPGQPDQPREPYPVGAQPYPAEGRPGYLPVLGPPTSRATRRRSGWLVAGIVVAAILVAVCALSALGLSARRSQTQDHTYRHTVDRVVVDVGSGDVTLGPGDAGRVAVHRRLTWSWSQPRIVETWSGNTLTVHYRCPGVNLGPGCGVDYGLRIPAGTIVDVHTGSGEIRVRDMAGPLTLDSGSGDVAVSGAGGTLSLHTGSGDVNASGLTATRASARTGSGDVTLRFTGAPATVTAESGSGDVRVYVPADTPYRVATHTGSGQVDVRVPTDPDASASITVRTGSGDVTIARP